MIWQTDVHWYSDISFSNFRISEFASHRIRTTGSARMPSSYFPIFYILAVVHHNTFIVILVLIKSVILMKSYKQGIFLIGHARRMWGCRKRQWQQDPEAYTNRIKTQQKECRLRPRNSESILNLCKANRERQRQYRLNESNEKKSLRKGKDRKSKRFKRKQQEDNLIIVHCKKWG